MEEKPDQPTVAWKRLDECVRAFTAAWDAASEPPAIAAFLPKEPAEMRRVVGIELVKLDLDRRWPKPQWRKPLENYLSELPELADEGKSPDDLVFEEFQVRRRHGDTPTPEEYRSRFPQQASALAVYLAAENPHTTTSLARLNKPAKFQAGQTIDDFDLLAPLGSGAFASVFLARQKSLGRMVALKISADRGFETQTLAQLDHPNIVRVYDERRLPEKQLHLMYMQYVAGGTLKDVVERAAHIPPAARTGKIVLDCVDEALMKAGQSPLEDSRTRQYLAQLSWPETVCWIGARIASALEHAHAAGVMHRDLKPANVLLAADGSPKLADFNVSSCEQVPGATAEAYFGGSLAYMSPEQLDACMTVHEGKPPQLDGRSDLFSLGILLWELLDCRRPFYDDVFFNLSSMGMKTMAARRKQGVEAKAYSRLPAGCPPGLIEVLAQCLEPNLHRRAASAGVVSRRLEMCLRPQVQSLLAPNRKSWLPVMRAHPLPFVLTAGMLPNVAASVMNIAYNNAEIIGHLEDQRVPQVFDAQLMTINPIAYALGIAIVMYLAWPVLRAVKRRAGQRSTTADLSRLRIRSLWLGDYVAWISGIEWVISGLIFPAWLQISLGTATGMSSRQWIHFFASQAVCGLMAATISFFLVTIAAVEVMCPLLLEPDEDDEAMRRSLERLSMRTGLYTFLSLAAIPLAVVVMPLVRTESQMAFLVVGLVGLIGTIFSFMMARRIQRASDALQIAVSVEDLTGSSTFTDSMRLKRSSIRRSR
jgi:serine/threonine protein kinase